MLERQFTSDGEWAVNLQKSLAEHALLYKPEPLDRSSSSSGAQIPQLLNLALYGCGGSGSRWSEALAELTPQITTVNVEGGWLVSGWNAGRNAVGQILLPTIGEKLAAIRSAYGLSTAALALVLRASRASVYNWLENEAPTGYFVQRIDQLNVIATEWQEMNLYHFSPGRLMKQKLGKGAAMLERLSREELDFADIKAGMRDLFLLMTNHRERMDKAAARAAKAQANTETDGEILERLTGSITEDR